MREFVTVTDTAAAGVAELRLSRPPDNTLDRQVYLELADAAAELAGRADVAAVVLYGGHHVFSAGDDVRARHRCSPAQAAITDAAAAAAFDAIAALPKPTVAAVSGYALGSGLSLALAADRRISGDNAKFGATEILAGLTPLGGGAARLARAIGAAAAKDLVFTGRFVDAEEALALGLVDEMVAPDDVHRAALSWARRVADHPVQVLAAAKARFAG
ncbi:enoyl-CoA hydratase-related protein [uncultured Mycolicibacterium sp.]|uniref:enoyl-CoA hydratase-related protein n=1 Tax=uncultured Mycolicibacterium sp. TaxID=2320817 RepID=UPI00260C59A1|nr:enoyl-CoA hydratase-related protein [uncultured Mycolicibacterium sp.]